jgi:hypothetical protein
MYHPTAAAVLAYISNGGSFAMMATHVSKEYKQEYKQALALLEVLNILDIRDTCPAVRPFFHIRP